MSSKKTSDNPWTPEQEKTLQTRWERGDSNTSIAEAVGRTPKSVRTKAIRMGFTRLVKKARSNSPWDEKREKDLQTRWERGDTTWDIAVAMGQSAKSIRTKAIRMGFERIVKPLFRPRLECWTEETKAALKVLWESGKTGGEIKDTLGLSRPAVMGQLRRMGLFGKRSWVRPSVRKPRPKSIPERPQTCSPPISIMELTYSTCRWPIGDPKEPDFGYCGQYVEWEPKSKPGEQSRVYCDSHHKEGHHISHR